MNPGPLSTALIEQRDRLKDDVAARSWKPYSEYRETGVHWLGKVPAHWDMRRLKTSLVRNDGGVWGEDIDLEGTIVLRSTEQAVDGKWTIDDPARRFLSSKERAAALLAEGDLVITKSSGSALHIGKTSLVNAKVAALSCCFSNFMQRLRCDSRSDPRFVHYLLNSPVGREQFDYGSNTTTGLANLNGGIIGNLRIAWPPLPEQWAIAAFLDRKTRQIDGLIEKKRRLIELLQEKRTALISHAVTRGLDPAAPMKPSGVEWLGDVPEHWEVKPVASLASPLVGFPFPSDGFSLDEGTALVRGDNVTTGSLRWGEKARFWPGEPPHVRYFLADGDIVIGMDGAKVGRNYAMVAQDDLPLLLVQRVTRLRAKPIMRATFLLHSIGNPRFHAHVDTHKTDPAIPHITLKDILSLPVCLPPTDEQDGIVRFIEREGGRLSALTQRAGDVVSRLIEYRQALISAAVTGKIDVREEVEA